MYGEIITAVSSVAIPTWAKYTAGAAVAGVCAPAILPAVGFGSAGVTAGSVAAGIQAGIGNVAAGSAFAAAQSAGATLTAGTYAASGAIGAGLRCFRKHCCW